MSTRKLIVDGVEYRYRVGSSGTKIYNGKTGSYVEHTTMFPGVDVERGYWKRWFSVEPHNVVNYIRANKL